MNKQTFRQTDIYTDEQTDIETNRHIYIQMNKQTFRQTDICMYTPERISEEHIDGQTDGQKHK